MRSPEVLNSWQSGCRLFAQAAAPASRRRVHRNAFASPHSIVDFPTVTGRGALDSPAGLAPAESRLAGYTPGDPLEGSSAGLAPAELRLPGYDGS